MNYFNAIDHRVTKQSSEVIANVLSQLTQCNPLMNDQRWVFLVAPNGLPDRQTLVDSGVNLDRLLVIHASSELVEKVALKAVNSGNASAVVSWGVKLNEQNKQAFNAATKKGNSLFIAVA